MISFEKRFFLLFYSIGCFLKFHIKKQKGYKLSFFKTQTKDLTLSKNQSGQVIVEYVLLLLVSSIMALALINLVSVDPNKSSPVFTYWRHLIEMVGSDIST